jgi:hypothetical protein
MIEDDAADQHLEIGHAQNAEEEAQQARALRSDETTYDFWSFMMSADMNELPPRPAPALIP